MSTIRGYDPLELLASQEAYRFLMPVKRIVGGDDVSFWLSSTAYTDIMRFLLQLNISMFPWQETDEHLTIHSWGLVTSDVSSSPTVSKLKALVSKLEAIIDNAPPDPGPRRFGNIAFRKWYQLVEDQAMNLLQEHLPEHVHGFDSSFGDVTPVEELKHYFLGSFGSAQRLDYGSGHELSFLAFIGGIWKLGGFEKTAPGEEERRIVLGIIEP